MRGSLGDPSERWRALLPRAGEVVAVALVYFLFAKASLAFASINPSATPIWPPSGLALGLVLLRGQRLLPAIFVGALAANFSTAGTIGTSVAIALGNTLEATIGALLVERWASGREAFRTPSGIGKFALIVAAVATPISATIGVATLAAAGLAAWTAFPSIWATWWLGDIAGALMVAPAIVLWARKAQSPAFSWKPGGETLLMLAFTIAVGAIALGPLLPPASGRNALAFLAVLPLLWAALRRGQEETATVALVLSGFAIWGVAAGNGPFIQATLNSSFLLLVSFVIATTLPSLALSAAMASRDRALIKNAEDYRRLMDSARDHAIFMLDSRGRVSTWNAGAERITQYSADEIVGRHYRRFFTGADQADGLAEGALARAAEAGAHRAEGWRVRRDGSRFFASAVVSGVRDERGALIGFAKVLRDTTAMHEAQAALEETREKLVQVQKLEALGQLTGGVAHDFNNLLMVIAGGLRALAGDGKGEQREAIVEEMRRAVERGAGLTRQLLAFARREPLSAETVDIAKRANAIEGLVRRSLRHDIRLHLDFPPGLWPIAVDPAQLDLAILNLAVNARDAMPEGGQLSIRARNLDAGAAPGGAFECVEIGVADTGAGMPPDVLARAFEPFYSTKGPGKGTGLGLSLVYAFATQSGGSALIESRPGAGTVVTLLLPRAAAAAADSIPAAVDEGPATIGGAALVVEDDDGVARVVGDMMEALGYRTMRAATADDALAKLTQNSAFDIVFSDIVMPGGRSGVELADEIRRRWPHLPILLTTGYSGDAGSAAERFRILRKPYGPRELRQALVDVQRKAETAPPA